MLRSILLLCAAVSLAGCGLSSDGGDTSQPRMTSEPTITMNPNLTTPLAGRLTVSTNEPTRITLDVSDGANSWIVNFDQFTRDHVVAVLGLRPARNHTIAITLIDADGNENRVLPALTITTDPLPANFPALQVTSNPAGMEPGVTLFNLFHRLTGVGFAVMVDPAGEVVWYYDANPTGFARDVRRISNGNLLVMWSDRVQTFEIDMLGTIVQIWHAAGSTAGQPGSTPVATKVFHHETYELPSGNFLALGVELREVLNFPGNDSDPLAPTITANVAGDTVVEYARDGTVINSWSMLDILDPLRIGYDSHGNFWDAVFPEAPGGTEDWAHGNAVVHDPKDDSLIVSLRAQDAVVKIKRNTGELVWILGPPANWSAAFQPFLLKPVGANFEWFYHQHASKLTPQGTILLFDNGTHRASPFDLKVADADNYSRAVEYSVDDVAMEVSQVWEFGSDQGIYGRFLGDADWMLNTGNVLINFGALAPLVDGAPSTRVIEVDTSASADVVFDLQVPDNNPNGVGGWLIYRSERLPGIYP